MQELIDTLREKLAFRHHRIAKHHADRRDFWRWKIGNPWLEIIPPWTPWAMLAAFWLMLWVLW